MVSTWPLVVGAQLVDQLAGADVVGQQVAAWRRVHPGAAPAGRAVVNSPADVDGVADDLLVPDDAVDLHRRQRVGRHRLRVGRVVGDRWSGVRDGGRRSERADTEDGPDAGSGADKGNDSTRTPMVRTHWASPREGRVSRRRRAAYPPMVLVIAARVLRPPGPTATATLPESVGGATAQMGHTRSRSPVRSAFPRGPGHPSRWGLRARRRTARSARPTGRESSTRRRDRWCSRC